MRKFLITKFVCSQCGRNLQLATDIPKNAGGASGYEEGQPTGAAMVEQLVAIEPCECLVSEIEKMRQAAKTLFEASQCHA